MSLRAQGTLLFFLLSSALVFEADGFAIDPKSPDFYERIGAPHESSPDELKRAYRAALKTYHPDYHPGQTEEFTALAKNINEAYEVLSNPEKRLEFDRAYRAAHEFVEALRRTQPPPRPKSRSAPPAEGRSPSKPPADPVDPTRGWSIRFDPTRKTYFARHPSVKSEVPLGPVDLKRPIAQGDEYKTWKPLQDDLFFDRKTLSLYDSRTGIYLRWDPSSGAALSPGSMRFKNPATGWTYAPYSDQYFSPSKYGLKYSPKSRNFSHVNGVIPDFGAEKLGPAARCESLLKFAEEHLLREKN